MKSFLKWLIDGTRLSIDKVRYNYQIKKLTKAYQAIRIATKNLEQLDYLVTLGMIVDLDIKARIIYLTLQEIKELGVFQSKFELEAIMHRITLAQEPNRARKQYFANHYSNIQPISNKSKLCPYCNTEHLQYACDAEIAYLKNLNHEYPLTTDECERPEPKRTMNDFINGPSNDYPMPGENMK